MHLLAAPMLAGLLLASVPIIIHLLNRRRFQLIEWAPMKYLKLTIKTNRRRMRIEQLLLLIVRTLIVALLFIALARPALSRNALGGFLAGRSRTSRVIVIDDSLSMGYQIEHRSAFDSAKEAASQIIRTLRPQDSVTVLLTSKLDEPLVREASIDDPGKLLSMISTLHLADSAADWPGVLKRVDDLLVTSAHPQKELVLLTDLRRSGWSEAVSKITAQLAAKSIDMKIVDVGNRKTDNIVLARFEQQDALALPGVPIKLRAAIRNDSTTLMRSAQATLEIDDQSRPLVLPDLPAGQITEVPITITLQKPGQHVVKLTLPTDALPADNERWLAISVRTKIEIALIDGQIGNGPFESSTDFLFVAFTAGADPWQVTRRSESEWQASSRGLESADVIAIANVASLSELQVKRLEKLVASGTGVMIFAGDQLDPQAYDARLYRDGAGLLPARVSAPIDEQPAGLTVESFDGSPLSALAKIAPDALARIRPRKFLAASVSDKSNDREVRVLARWNDSESHPAIIEKTFGRGRVILFTISADRQWSEWPVDPTYVLATRSAALAIARPDSSGDNFIAGQPIAYRIEESHSAISRRVTGPDDSASRAMSLEDRALHDSHTSRAGKYVLKWKDETGVDQSRTLCASFDTVESNLEPIAESDLRKLLNPLSPTIVQWTAGADPLTEHGREIWRTLVIAVLTLALFETALAVWVGREK